MPDVTWHPVTLENWQAALSLAVLPDQQRFVADYAPIAAIGLAKAYLRPGGLTWVPYALYVEGVKGVEGASDAVPVGFTMLAFQPESHDDYWIVHYFIDRRSQGRGCGKAGLEALIALLRREHPGCQAVHLTVHPENQRAQRLYAGAGFRPTGAERWGESVYRLALSGADADVEGR